MITEALIRRVARDFMSHNTMRVASVTKGMAGFLTHLVRGFGGASFVRSAMERDTELLPAWDKGEFYHRGGAEYLLEHLADRAKGRDIVAALEPLWRRSVRGVDGELYDEGLNVGFEFEGKFLTLHLEAYGPTFAQQGDDSDYHGDFVEVPDDDADISREIEGFGKALGAGVRMSEDRVDAEFPGYDQFKYTVTLVWRASAEELVRKSFGKLVDEAGRSIRWDGED